MSLQSVFSVCGMCPARCPIEVEIESGKIRLVHGNRYFPGIRGALCTRGAAGIPFIQDMERPQFPLVRTGARGGGRWRRLPWEEAFSLAAEKINAVRKSHGGKAILWQDTGGAFSDLRRAFVRGLNSPNFFAEESMEGVNRQMAALSLFGFTDDQLVLDLANAKETVLQGRNLFESVNIEQANHLMDGMARGGRLTVIDVRSTVTSGKADRFFMIRPGTDYIFNLSIIHTLISKKLYQSAYADKWISGIENLKRSVAPYTPETAEKETGIKAETIVRFAESLAKAAPSVIWHPGWHTDKYKDSYFVCRTAFIINALLGSIGVKGGVPLVNRPEDAGKKGLNKFADLFSKVTEPRVDSDQDGIFAAGSGRLHKAFQSIETAYPYAIKGLVTYQQDPLSDMPDPVRMKSLMEKLEFCISITSTWSQTAWMSDLILPLSPYLERESIIGQIDGLQPTYLMRNRCAEPRFDTLSDWEIVTGLAKQTGIQSLVFKSVEDIWKYQLTDTTVNLLDFDAKGYVRLTDSPMFGKFNPDYRFATASGKIEVMGNPNQPLSGLDPYKNKQKPSTGVFRLTVGGCGFHSGGGTINNLLLNKQMPINVLWINKDAAGQMGIENGDTVLVSAKDRSGRIGVKVTEYIHPEAVFLVTGFGRSLPVESRSYGRGIAANLFMPGGLDMTDSAGGGVAVQEQFVEIRKI